MSGISPFDIGECLTSHWKRLCYISPSSELGNMREIIHILLVDDQAIIRESLAALLSQRHGLDIIGEASNGQMAVELAQKLHPDVIIMDVRMPVLNGIEATRLIMSNSPDTIVIGFTMDAEAGLGDAMKKAGAAVCMYKNESIEVLVKTIRNCCPA